MLQYTSNRGNLAQLDGGDAPLAVSEGHLYMTQAGAVRLQGNGGRTNMKWTPRCSQLHALQFYSDGKKPLEREWMYRSA